MNTFGFRVNMSNQKVLGYFKPEMGDKVAVTGSFNSWSEEGIILEQQDSLVYGLTFPVKVRKYEPLVYKYIIIPGAERKEQFIMPNNGWEFRDNRLYREESLTEYFNNQKRVLRVVVSEEWLAQRANLKQDDVLLLKLMWNGSQSRNYRLEPNGNGAYETALQIPESAADVGAKIIVNYEHELYVFDEIKVGVKGKTVVLEEQKVQL